MTTISEEQLIEHCQALLSGKWVIVEAEQWERAQEAAKLLKLPDEYQIISNFDYLRLMQASAKARQLAEQYEDHQHAVEGLDRYLTGAIRTLQNIKRKLTKNDQAETPGEEQ